MDETDKNDAYDYAQTEALFHQFVEMTLSGNLEMAQRLVDRNRPVEPVLPVPQSIQEKPDEPLISTLIQDYLKEHKNTWAQKTYISYQSDLNLFLSNIKDKPINKYTKQDFLQFRETLKSLPARNKKGNKSITARRANNIIGNISTFFNWCDVTRDVIDKNIAQGKSLPTPKEEKENKRERWSKEDLEVIFF